MPNLSLSETEAARVASKRGGRRVTLADIEANIADRLFFTGDQAWQITRSTSGPVAGGTVGALSPLTVCILVLRNGFTIIGKSAPADPKNFDPELGRKFALEDAMRQCWPLMGYHLRQAMWEQDTVRAMAGLEGRNQMAGTGHGSLSGGVASGEGLSGQKDADK